MATDYTSKFTGSQIDEGVEKGLSVGSVSLLSTVDKSNVINAINECVSNNQKNMGMPSYDSENFVITFKTNDGTSMLIDLPIESLTANLDYDPVNKTLLIKKEDGNVISISVNDLVDVYRGSTGSQIQTVINNNIIQSSIINGSIGEDKIASSIISKINVGYDHSQSLGNPHDTRCSFGAKWAKTGLNINIPVGNSYNILQILNLTTDLVHAGNIPVSSYNIVNPGTSGALMRLPNINKFVDYVITIRLIGNVGTSSDVMEFFVDLQRADGSLVDGKPVIKNLDNSLNRRGVNIETATYDSSDNYITNGVKIVINNPSQGSRSINITGYEILIKGNM